MIYKTNIKQLRYLKLLAILSLSVFWTVGLNRNHILAQSNIVSDDTLGEERSRVVPFNGNIDTIRGGAVRGSNLFHSFREFNIGLDKGAYFFSPNAEIQNILARVTGRNPSEILGVLGTRVFDGNRISASNANLFLINPNGIVFGENASLDVGGSFVATTANGIGFGEQGVFSASNPETPRLLSVNPSAFLFNQIAVQPIVNKSRATNATDPSFIDGLRVPDGKNLLFLGGDISLDGGFLNAVGGKTELGGLAAPGVVNLNIDGNNLDVTFPDNVEYSDILLQNQAFINTSGSGGGEIQIQGNNVTLKDNSNISSFTNDGRDGKEINIKATRLDILGTSNIQTGAISTGNSGNISIKTRNLNILNGGQISASSFNQGAGGNIEIDADTVEIIGVSTNGTSPSGIGSETVGVNSSNAGNVTLNTRILNIRDGGILSTQTINQGKGGDLILTARESLNINGFAPSNRPGSQFFISVLSTSAGGLGKAGNLKISNTGTIKIENGGQISASSFNQGAGGNIEINADTVEIIGVSTNGILRSGIGNETSGVNSSANAGNITLDSRILNIRDGGILSTRTINQGKGGDLILTARESLNISGFAPTDSQFFFSGLFTSAGGLGKAGNLKIVDTGIIKIENGGRISASTFAQGNGGNIEIDADTVEIIGVSNNGIVSSGIRNETLGVNSSANAGNLTLNTRILNIRDGGAISTQTFNQGKSGDLTLTAKESLNISGFALSNLPDNQFFFSDLNTSARGLGEAGNLKIVDTGIIKIENGGQISASTFAQGNGGNIEIDADTVEIIGVSTNGILRSAIGSETSGVDSSANAGNLTLNTRILNIRDGGAISTQTFNQGKGGDLTLTARESLNISGFALSNLPNSQFFTSGLSTSAGSSGEAGNLKIFDTGIIKIENGGQIIASTFAQGAGGNIDINANTLEIIGVSTDGRFPTGVGSETSGIDSSANAGNVTLNTRTLNLSNGASLSTRSVNQGKAGNINIQNSDRIQLTNGNILSSSSQSSGGAIAITAKDIRLFGDSNIATFVFSGAGGGGNINLNANTIIALDDSDILSFAGDGKGGDITFNTEAFFSKPLYRPTSVNNTNALTELDDNNRVDVNASGTVSGTIAGIPDTTFIQDNLTELPDNQIDTNVLVASSCIVSNNQQNGTFFVTGAGGLPQNPSDAPLSNYSTGKVQSIPSSATQIWKIGDPIVEPSGAYQLPNGQILLSRECSK